MTPDEDLKCRRQTTGMWITCSSMEKRWPIYYFSFLSSQTSSFSLTDVLSYLLYLLSQFFISATDIELTFLMLSRILDCAEKKILSKMVYSSIQETAV